MNDFAVGSTFILLGVFMIAFRVRFVRYSTEYRNKYLGFNFGERTIKFGTRFAILLGLIIIVCGILAGLGLSDVLMV